MKRTLFVVLLGLVCLAFAATTFSVYAEQPAASKTSGIADDLSSKLSLKPEQAIGAAGSIFALAKSKLSAADFGKIAAGIPEMDSLLKAVPAAGGDALSAVMASQSGTMRLMSQFKTLGISPETAAKVIPEALSFVKSKQGDEVMNLLSKAIQ